MLTPYRNHCPAYSDMHHVRLLCSFLVMMENALSQKIILNNFLIFELEKILTFKGRTVTISSSLSMCLKLLIENVGHLVTHQQFYDYVWRRLGTEPASNSLYQNISALRRAFIKTGFQEDIIRTLPRNGFLLSPQTTIIKESLSGSFPVGGQPDDSSGANLTGSNEEVLKEKLSLGQNEKSRFSHYAFFTFFSDQRSSSLDDTVLYKTAGADLAAWQLRYSFLFFLPQN